MRKIADISCFFCYCWLTEQKRREKENFGWRSDGDCLYHGGKTGGHRAGTEDHGGNPSADFAWT